MRKDIYTNQNISEIESTDWDFIGEYTQMHMHSIHPYPARMIPQIPHKAMNLWTKEGDMVLDPFAGCGTTLLEAVIHNRNAIGIDNNPVACLISQSKITKYSEEEISELKHFLDSLENIISAEDIKADVPVYKNIEYWFDRQAIQELGKIRAGINTLSGNARMVSLCCFSAIVVRISYQASDTKYSRKAYEYVEGSALKSFKSKLKSTIKSIEEINHRKTGKASVLHIDGRNIEEVGDETISLIVTSPPYLNAYDYHKYHRHRMQWIDGDVDFARDREIGKHDTFTKKGATPDQYFEDMGKCFSEWSRVLKKGARCLIVVGDAIVSGKPVAVGDTFIEMLKTEGMILEQRWIRNVDINKKSFNQKSRIKREHVLLFRKPE